MQQVVHARQRLRDNFRDESVMEYKLLKQKQLSKEIESKMERQIADKLSAVDEVLRKATLAQALSEADVQTTEPSAAAAVSSGGKKKTKTSEEPPESYCYLPSKPDPPKKPQALKPLRSQLKQCHRQVAQSKAQALHRVQFTDAAAPVEHLPTSAGSQILPQKAWCAEFSKLKKISVIAQGPDLFFTHYALFVLSKRVPKPI